jgi:hypothetical protein
MYMPRVCRGKIGYNKGGDAWQEIRLLVDDVPLGAMLDVGAGLM